MRDLFDLSGMNALVTGGASGIGLAVASGLRGAGARVAITVHSRRPDEPFDAMLEADLGDLDANGAETLVGRCVAELGGLDILVNNAGIILRDNAVDYSENAWRSVMQLNLDAAWFLSQAAGRRMLAHGRGGRIVNVASVLSEQGGLYVPAYTAAKHALAGITKALANEWAAHGINVNAIAPGYTITTNTAAIREDEERARALLARIPAGRFAEPGEMAGAVIFFCSKAASYCHGSLLAVDGGWLAR